MATEVISSNPKLIIEGPGPVIIGGFTPIPDAAHNPQILELAIWAIHEHNKDTAAKLEIVKVISAAKKVLPDTITYRITFEARHLVLKLPNMYYVAEVLEKVGAPKELIEFKEVGIAA